MIASPAAVVAGRVGGPATLAERLEALVECSSQGESRGFVERLLPAAHSGEGEGHEATEGFSWLIVPELLAALFGLDSTPAGRGLVDDLRWIQFCIYGVFRVQDDLVDGDVADATLAVQTNHLMVEAARCAARHFASDSPFWEVFHDTIDATSRAIVALDRRQRATGADSSSQRAAGELELYVDLSACLKIAAAGVAIAAGHAEAWRNRISPALDGLAVAGQIVDDLRDVSDDLADGRVNYAAWFLSHPILGATAEAVEAVVAANLANTDRLERLIERACETMDEGLAALGATLCPELHDYLRDYREGLVGLGERIVASRRVVLGDSPTQSL